ncbi:MAG: DUF6273 domain-containing protein [Oscillospiraceae bacterium]|nr:DUF6273 domain-containing protein [Oscillospiraceae bacterium]
MSNNGVPQAEIARVQAEIDRRRAELTRLQAELDNLQTELNKLKGGIYAAEVGDTFSFGPFDWRVLKKENGKALIITKDIIEMRIFDSHRNFWERSELFRYLIGDFFSQTFNEDEDSKIDGFVFILSIEEAKALFKNDADRKATYNGAVTSWWLRSPGRYENFVCTVDDDGSCCVLGGDIGRPGGVRPALWLKF